VVTCTAQAIDLATGKVAWTHSLKVTNPSTATIAVGSGDMFVAYNGESPPGSGQAAIILSSYSESTGALLHTVALTSESFPTPMILVDGNLYLEGDGFGAVVYALRQSNLAPLWSTAVDRADAPVTLAGKILVVPGICGQAVGLDPATGTILWQDTPGCFGGGGTMSSVVNNTVWGDDWTTDGGRIYMPSNGAILGQYTGYAPDSGFGEAVQAVRNPSNGVLTLRAFDPTTQATHWTFTEPASTTALGSDPLLADGFVFAEGGTGAVWALNPCTGTVAWQGRAGSTAPELGTDPLAGLAVGDGYLVVPTATGVTAFRGAGQPPATPPSCP
jgi:outer membrane protein assembly factor BamB